MSKLAKVASLVWNLSIELFEDSLSSLVLSSLKVDFAVTY